MEIFISYSHADENLRQALDIHLVGLQRQGLINTWHDRKLLAGTEIDREISKHMLSASVILLLISPNFIASDYCYNIEMSEALERHKNNSCHIVPIILRPCDWQNLPFGKILAIPPDGKPITKYPSLDDGFYEVVKELKRIIESISQKEETKFINQPLVQTPATIARSSNLRVKHTFSDADKDKFELDSFEYIACFFENSLAELQQRNAYTQCRYRRINANSFEAILYINGQQKAQCLIVLNKDLGFNGITFSYGNSPNSINECLHIETDGYSQYLKGMGFSSFSTGSLQKNLTMEGAAEILWDMFIRNAQ